MTKAPVAGPSTITGTPGRDILTGTHGNDIFIGKGELDTFVFRPVNGNDVINDFQPGHFYDHVRDVIDVRQNGFTGYIDLLTHIHWSGNDTLIALNDGGSIRLKGVTPNELHIDNFKIF